MTVNQNVEEFAKEWSGKDINSVKAYWGEFVPALRALVQMERNDALREAVKKIESLETVVSNDSVVDCPYKQMRTGDCFRGVPANEEDWFSKFFNEYKDINYAMFEGEKYIVHRDSYEGIVTLLPLNHTEIEEKRKKVVDIVIQEVMDGKLKMSPLLFNNRVQELMNKDEDS